MLTVHHLQTSRSQRILWLLEELGLPYELKIHQRDKATRLAPPELKAIHPLGKAPVITDGELVIAESGAILEYLVETYGEDLQQADLQNLVPKKGTAAHRDNRFWMHYAEGSLMNWLVMKLVFTSLPNQPMPFFVKPIARGICQAVQTKLIDPNLKSAMEFMNSHLSKNTWFAGDDITLCDFQMSFAVEAALMRADRNTSYPFINAFKEKINQRPAYIRAIAKGGPVVMAMPQK